MARLPKLDIPPCHKNNHQIDPNPAFLTHLTSKPQDSGIDRKSCYMCVEPKKDKYVTIDKTPYYPPNEETCPNLNSGESIFTGPNGQKW
eukprot:897718_1